MEASTAFRRSSRQVSCDLNGEAAILQLDQSVYFGLTGVGASVWAALETPRSMAELESMVRREFDVDADRCASDLMQFLIQLQEAGLVETFKP
jgi:hypothetical protein